MLVAAGCAKFMTIYVMFDSVIEIVKRFDDDSVSLGLLVLCWMNGFVVTCSFLMIWLVGARMVGMRSR